MNPRIRASPNPPNNFSRLPRFNGQTLTLKILDHLENYNVNTLPKWRGEGKAYLRCKGSLVAQMGAQSPNDIQLLFSSQSGNSHLNNTTDIGLVSSNETLVVHVGQCAHNELAIHTIRHATMTGDRMAKVLDLESPFDAGCKETTEGSDQRGKG